MTRTSLSLLALLALVACDKQNSSTTTTSAEQKPITTTTSTMPGPKPTTETTPKPSEGAASAGKPVVTWKDGLSTPESVLYDDKDDDYIVSNINGQPLGVDGNGYLSRLSPDGKVLAAKWIEGGKNKAVLNAPKGLAFVGDVLYVADIDTVRMFNRKTGAPMGDVKVPGATFLNDIVPMGDGKIAVSDSAMKAGAGGKLEPSGSDAVYTISTADKTKKATPIAKAKDLGGPNGLAWSGDKLWVVTFGTNELYSLDAAGKKGDVTKMPKGTLDGLLVLPGGDLLVSSWDAQTIWRGRPGGEFKVAIEDVRSPADIGYDGKRNRVLVPIFEGNEVRAYDLK